MSEDGPGPEGGETSEEGRRSFALRKVIVDHDSLGIDDGVQHV